LICSPWVVPRTQVSDSPALALHQQGPGPPAVLGRRGQRRHLPALRRRLATSAMTARATCSASTATSYLWRRHASVSFMVRWSSVSRPGHGRSRLRGLPGFLVFGHLCSPFELRCKGFSAGNLFCFRGRRRLRVHEAPRAGRFNWPSPAEGVVTISSAQLGYLLSGWRHPQDTWAPTSVGWESFGACGSRWM